MYKAQTRGISVTVMPRFVEEESSPGESRYFFAYTVEIVNNGSEQVQLRSRHWRIVDGRGETPGGARRRRRRQAAGARARANRSATPAAARSPRRTA